MTDDKKKQPLNVAEIYRGVQEVLLTQYRTLFARAQAPHHATRGALYEQLIRDFFAEYLPQQFYIGTGQVVGSLPALSPEGVSENVSRQTDVVIFDALHHPILLPKYELFPIEGTLATIEVKSKLGKSELVGDKKSAGALKNIASVKSLGSWARDQPLRLAPDPPADEPPLSEQQKKERMDSATQEFAEGFGPLMSQEEKQRRKSEARERQQQHNHRLDRQFPQQHNHRLDRQFPLGVVLAFETEISPEALLEHWRDWNEQYTWQHRTEMICILKQNLLLIDTSRIDKLWDSHQLAGNFLPPDKLIALESEYMFLVFFTLLLRRLRVRSAITSESIETTPISYFRELPWERVAEVDVPICPHLKERLSSFGQFGSSDEEQV